jgi:hypothetical protein
MGAAGTNLASRQSLPDVVTEETQSMHVLWSLMIGSTPGLVGRGV